VLEERVVEEEASSSAVVQRVGELGFGPTLLSGTTTAPAHGTAT
jgi:hypothetical protein